MVVVTFIIAGLVLFALIYAKIFIRPKSFPPGPIPLPVIGNIHLIGSEPQKSLKALAKKYGDVFSVYFGGWPVVVISSIEAAKESLIQKSTDFAGRPNSYTGIEAAKGHKTGRGIDIVYSDYGPYWQTIRKLAHKALKMYGANRVQLEKTINTHADELMERLAKIDGQCFDPKRNFCLAATNIICQIVFGSKYNIDDEEFTTIIHYCKLLVEGIAGANGVDFLTWMSHFPNHNISLIRESGSLRDPILAKWLKKHRETFEKGNIRDFTDALIDAADEEIKQNKSSDRYLKEDNMMMIMADVFNAGIETTTTTMNWFVAFSVLWPETQKKIHEELDRVIGRTRKPCMDDRSALNYLEAAINETARMASVVPLAVPHSTTCDTSVAGYKIPKGTHVFYNLYAMHRDERHWVDPEDFRPERWLNEEGNYVAGAHNSFLPFSAGKRVCFGEALAKMELFLILAQVYQRFEFLPGNKEDLPKLDGFVFITHEPKPYKIQIRKRF
ncbi:steroid 17-alpha-hydroxylase/17,20 lyase-like isoform X3 [Rhopilema esculentum]|uniref:steroid 17-alpha-hydroxylase/17,20 lyase-like isoform X3 n=1 Tax=Rhopilema esculentum TaxID=499914 RepID=UPI0031DE5BF8